MADPRKRRVPIGRRFGNALIRPLANNKLPADWQAKISELIHHAMRAGQDRCTVAVLREGPHINAVPLRPTRRGEDGEIYPEAVGEIPCGTPIAFNREDVVTYVLEPEVRPLVEWITKGNGFLWELQFFDTGEESILGDPVLSDWAAVVVSWPPLDVGDRKAAELRGNSPLFTFWSTIVVPKTAQISEDFRRRVKSLARNAFRSGQSVFCIMELAESADYVLSENGDADFTLSSQSPARQVATHAFYPTGKARVFLHKRFGDIVKWIEREELVWWLSFKVTPRFTRGKGFLGPVSFVRAATAYLTVGAFPGGFPKRRRSGSTEVPPLDLGLSFGREMKLE